MRTLSEEQKNTISQLYMKDRLSMAQIASKLGLSPSGIAYVLDKVGVERRSISEAITTLGIVAHGKRPCVIKENLSRKEQDLKIAGTMLYWGEGGKTRNFISFANSDPEMIRVFLTFLREICGIDEKRLKVLIHRYPDHDPEILQKFWEEVTGIPKNRFYREFVHAGKKGTYKTKSRYGTLAVTYSDKRLLGIVLRWVDEYRQNLL